VLCDVANAVEIGDRGSAELHNQAFFRRYWHRRSGQFGWVKRMRPCVALLLG
jgi:hypothetical protein